MYTTLKMSLMIPRIINNKEDEIKNASHTQKYICLLKNIKLFTTKIFKKNINR